MKRMDMDEMNMRGIELGIVLAPNAHPIIRGLRGVRKARIAIPGRGKRGGGRVIYFVAGVEAIYMLTAYPKNERDDLTTEQRKAILGVIDGLRGDAL